MESPCLWTAMINRVPLDFKSILSDCMFAVRHTSRTIIDKHYGKWISEDAAFMAQMASDRLKMTRTRRFE
jgi:hypothetical protein